MKSFLQITISFTLLLFCSSLQAQVVPSIQWQKSFGGSGDDETHSVHQTSDGGFIAAGYSTSNDGNVTGNHGPADYWIVKLSAGGDLVWQKCLGGSGDEGANSIQETADGGYIVAGLSDSNDGDVSGNYGYKDVWIVKLANDGILFGRKILEEATLM